ncbi:hypothetical protein ACFYPG_30640 [Micromonospora sp. NPDC005553]|uniref:hypothetical protein n=1 Tax=Micromonospora sp. NPDC005553 TaxID=3364232 RepID=UPI0036CEEE87
MDVMFRGVTALRLRDVYANLVIDRVPPEEVSTIVDNDIDGAVELDSHVFSLGVAGGSLGFVVAGSAHFSEDDMEYGEPSSIDHPELSAHVLRSGDFG